jgi:YggT family protein
VCCPRLVAALASTRHAGLPTAFTEPVIGPVRRVLKSVRLGSVSVDLAFTAVLSPWSSCEPSWCR